MAIRTLKDTGSEYTIPSNVDGAVYRLITADCIIGEVGDQFATTQSATSLVLTFTKGCQAIIGGNAFWLTSDESINLPANSTFYVCLRIDTSKPNGQTGSIECLTEAAIKSGDINNGGIRDLKLYYVVTSASGVTTFNDLRNIIKDTDYANKTYVDNKDNALESKISTAQNTANSAVNAAANAQNTANSGVSKAEAAQNTANSAVNAAANAQNTANSGVSKAEAAQNTANSAVNAAANAQNTANSGVSKAEAAQNSANSALSRQNISMYVSGSTLYINW